VGDDAMKTTGVVMKIGDRVNVDSFEGFGGTGVIVEEREHDYCRFRVCMDGAEQPPFWAHDHELSPLIGDETKFDARPDTWKHIQDVRCILNKVISDICRRQAEHDASKLRSPEAEAFNEYTPKLKGTTYGSEEYKRFLADMKPALDHHYAHNSHHPEHYRDGIRGMNLLDVVEMLCDWLAATKRHADGDIRKSIAFNQKRFGYTDELKSIFLNTLPLLES
jgi:hypothetical protein